MMIYFEFEEERRKAEVSWPGNTGGGSISVELSDSELAKKLPSDFIFDINKRNKVSYTIENPDNKRLVQLQKVICRRLQEFANQL